MKRHKPHPSDVDKGVRIHQYPYPTKNAVRDNRMIITDTYQNTATFRFWMVGAFSFLLCLFSTSLSGQSIDRQVIGLAGGISTGNGITVSWTAGEMAVQRAYAKNGSGSVTEGFQQPHLSLIPESTQSLDVSFFPNPVSHLFTVRLSAKEERTFTAQILDQQGRIVQTVLGIVAGDQQIDVEALPAGAYHLRLIPENDPQQASSYQLLKIGG